MKSFALALASAAIFAASGLVAHAQMKTLTVNLTEAQEVPPHQGQGAGTAMLTLDPATKGVSWKITWRDLSSAAIMAHIHGPASPTTNGPVLVWLSPKGKMANLTGPIEGSAKLTDAQWADLMAGKDYINVHTTTNKGGEIRGQIVPGM